MDKFKDVVMKLFQNADPEQKSSIQEHLTNFISDAKPPNHPPYAAMIYRAIEELNEKRGSSEESISQNIKKQYTDLPLAHNSLLKHHLGELCKSGEILVTAKHLYLLPGTNPALEACVTAEKDDPKRKKRTRRGRGRIGKKEESDEYGETRGEAEGETNRCNKEKDELIGAHNKVKVDYNVNKVGELIHVVNPTLEFCVTADKDNIKRKKRTRRWGARICKKDEESDKHGETHGEAKGETDRCNKEKDELVGEHNQMEVDYNVDKVEELIHVTKQTEIQDTGMIDEQNQLHQQQSLAISAPVVDSNQLELSSPAMPPGFEFVKFQSDQKDMTEQKESERNFSSVSLSESETLQKVDHEQHRQLKCEFQRFSKY